jgi:putative DNA primase/helicase
MIAQVRGFLEAHGESRFSPAEGDAPRTINRAGFRRQGPDGDEFLVLPEVFRSEVCRGFDFRAVARALADVGALMLDADGTCTRSERLPGIKKGRVYRIGPAIWSASND